MIVYVIILAVIMGFLMHFLWAAKKTETGRKRLDIFQDLRLSSAKVSHQLSYATQIVFPPADGRTYRQLAFISNLGELHVIFLDDKNMLYMLNYDEYKRSGKGLHTLAQRTIEFNATRPVGTEEYVQFTARILDETNTEFVLTDGIAVRNLIY